MIFRYKKIELQLGGRREYLLKPIIPVYLFYKKSFIRLEALIDSGADFCVFDKEIASVLGLKWKKGVPHDFFGVTGEKGVVYFHQLKLRVGNKALPVEVGFSSNLSEQSCGILGQEGFFENFKVSFSLAKETIEVMPNNV